MDEQVQKLTGSESLSAEIEKQAENLRAEAKRAGEKLVAAAEQQRDKLVEEAAKKGKLAEIAAKAAGEKLVIYWIVIENKERWYDIVSGRYFKTSKRSRRF